jgi:hypothetical protein
MESALTVFQRLVLRALAALLFSISGSSRILSDIEKELRKYESE